jgi:hypothetical protein
MARGLWFAVPTHIELSQAWKVTVEAIRSYAMEASHLLEVDHAELAAMRLASAYFFSRIAKRAERERSKATGLPDWRSAMEARQLADRHAGLDIDKAVAASTAPTKIEIVMLDAPPAEPPPDKSPAEPPPDKPKDPT